MLFVFLLILHYIADYSHLQTDWMLKGKNNLELFPLMSHAGVHAGLMLIPLLMWSTIGGALLLALLQFGAHFGIDFAKCYTFKKFPWLRKTRWNYYVDGGDQLAHVLIVYLITIMAI